MTYICVESTMKSALDIRFYRFHRLSPQTNRLTQKKVPHRWKENSIPVNYIAVYFESLLPIEWRYVSPYSSKPETKGNTTKQTKI